VRARQRHARLRPRRAQEKIDRFCTCSKYVCIQPAMSSTITTPLLARQRVLREVIRRADERALREDADYVRSVPRWVLSREKRIYSLFAWRWWGDGERCDEEQRLRLARIVEACRSLDSQMQEQQDRQVDAINEAYFADKPPSWRDAHQRGIVAAPANASGCGLRLVIPKACTLDGLPDDPTTPLELPPLEMFVDRNCRFLSSGAAGPEGPPYKLVIDRYKSSKSYDDETMACFSADGLIQCLPHDPRVDHLVRFLKLICGNDHDEHRRALVERLSHLQGTCMFCGRKLKTASSLERAMGPTCFKRMSDLVRAARAPGPGGDAGHHDPVRGRVERLASQLRSFCLLRDAEGDSLSATMEDVTEQLRRLRAHSDVVDSVDELLRQEVRDDEERGKENESGGSRVRAFIASTAVRAGIVTSSSSSSDDESVSIELVHDALRDVALFYASTGDVFKTPDLDGILPEGRARLAASYLVADYLGMTAYRKRAQGALISEHQQARG